MNKKIYVIAGNTRQAKQWIRANRIAPKDACIVVQIEQLYGIRGNVAVLHGTYWENRAYQHENFESLIRAAELRVQTERRLGDDIVTNFVADDRDQDSQTSSADTAPNSDVR